MTTPRRHVSVVIKPSDEPPPLPRGWAWASIEDVAERVNPGFPSGKHNKEGIGVPHLRPMNVTSRGEISLTDTKYVSVDAYDRLRAGDVLFNNTNSPSLVGKTAFVHSDTQWAYSNHMTRIRLRPCVAEPAWVANALYLGFIQGFFLENCTHHVNQASIASRFLSTLRIPLAPLPEQRRIVAKIEELLSQLDAAILALNRALVSLKRSEASLRYAACEGRLVAQDANDEPARLLLERILAERRRGWEADLRARGKDPNRAEYKEPSPPNRDVLPELPLGWCWASAEQVCETVASGATPPADKMANGTGEIPFIKVYNLTFDGSLAFEDKPTFVSKHTHLNLLGRSRSIPGDVLTNIVGPPLGKVSVVPDTYAEWNMNQAVVLFRPSACIESGHLCSVLLSPATQRRLQKTAKATAGQFNLAVTACRTMAIPLPPLPEQRRILAETDRRLSLIRKTRSVVEANFARAERLRQAILDCAFKGRLAPQNPAEESAYVLLERVKASCGTADGVLQRAGRAPAKGRKSAPRSSAAGSRAGKQNSFRPGRPAGSKPQ